MKSSLEYVRMYRESAHTEKNMVLVNICGDIVRDRLEKVNRIVSEDEKHVDPGKEVKDLLDEGNRVWMAFAKAVDDKVRYDGFMAVIKNMSIDLYNFWQDIGEYGNG